MKGKAHKQITRKAVEVFTEHQQSDFGKLLKHYDGDVVEGSVEADLFPILDRMKNWHFYRENDHLQPMDSVLGTVYPTSDHILAKRIAQLKECIVKANGTTSAYKKDNALEDLFEFTGRALHHIQDMSTPSHVTPIYHGPDFPFDQVENALIVKDHYEDFSAKKEILMPLVDAVTVSKDEFDIIAAGVGGSTLLDIYEEAAQSSLSIIFEDYSSNFIEGKINGQITEIPLSLFWQKNDASQDRGRIKGFGSFGPLSLCFADPGITVLDDDGNSYSVETAALKALYDRLLNKMIRDSLCGLFVVEKMMAGVG